MQIRIDTLKWLLLVAAIMVPIAIYPPLIILVIIAGSIFATYDRDTKISKHVDTTSYDNPKPYVNPFEPPEGFTTHPTFIAIEKRAYLLTPEWQALRKAVLKRDIYTCQSCGTYDVPLEVHHLHYRTFKAENLSDLVSLCRDCHQAVHDKHGYEYTDEFPIN